MRFLIAATLFLAPTVAMCQSTVVVTQTDGSIVKGELKSLTTDQVLVASDDMQHEWSLDQLQEIRFSDRSKTGETSVRVYLHDGSQLNCRSYLVADGMATCEFDTSTAKVPTSGIHYVRYAPFRREVDKQWEDALEAGRVSDTLVVRRPSDVIDYLDGVVGEITSGHVKFQYDGEWNDVSYDKIDGFVYFKRESHVFPKPVCSITTGQGSVLAVDAISLGNEFSVSTLDGQSFTLPVNDVQSIKFTNRGSVYLSDIEPERLTWRPEIESSITDELSQFFQPRMDRNFQNDSLAVRMNGEKRVFKKGISAISHSEITYRLAGEYRSFEAIVGIDAEIVPNGEARLEIWGDSRKLLDRTIKGTDLALPIEVPLWSVGRMRIVVTHGSFLGDGDYINLCDARLLK